MKRTTLSDNVELIQDIEIADGVTQSEIVDLQGLGIFGVLAGTGFAGTSLTLEATVNDTDFVPVLAQDGTAFTITIAADEYCIIPIASLPGICKFRFVSSAVGSGGDDTLSVFARNLD